MSDNELERIRQRKLEMLMKLQAIPKDIVNIHTDSDLNKLTKDFPDKIVIIDFWAVWCAPCKVYAPIFEKFHQEYYGDFIFAKVNVDENPMVAQYFGITSIPTTTFIKNRQVLRKFVGLMNYDTLKHILEKLKS